jgi:DNA (cytosine-5)-methyltransferase 1
MDFLSVCSGFGGAELAFDPLGWVCNGVAEIDPAARAVLRHRWPETRNYGDFTKITAGDAGAIDLLVGGTPCQSFSVAGLRGGLGDERGNLALEFLRLVDRKRPRWVVWENVPGVFSSTSHVAPDSRPPAIDLESGDGPGDGEEVVVEDEYDADEDHAFACFLAGLSELGYQYAYRTLDAQHFGVPQRRRRVFVVGYLGDWRRAAAVLFERHCLSGYPPPSREKGQVAPTIPARSLGGGGLGTDFDCDGGGDL